MQIIEQFSTPKTQDRLNEDICLLTSNYAAVIDGAGDPLRRTWRGRSLGWHAAQAVQSAIRSLPPNISATDAVNEITTTLRKLISQLADDDIQTPHPAANLVIYSAQRREVWRIGDGQVRIDQTNFCPKRKAFEQLLIDVRRLILLAGRYNGDHQQDLDTDVASVYKLLYRYQEKCQNTPAPHPFSFVVLDGQAINPSGIEVIPVQSSARELILASDGYPVILPTLDATEMALAKILNDDPPLIGEHAQTSAPTATGTSFDDRTYIRIAL